MHRIVNPAEEDAAYLPGGLTAGKLRRLADIAEVCAVQDSTPGAVFRGAFKAAEDSGYPTDPERGMFTTVYVATLPRDGVVVDEHNIVVERLSKVDERLAQMGLVELVNRLFAHNTYNMVTREVERVARLQIGREMKRRGILPDDYTFKADPATRPELLIPYLVQWLESRATAESVYVLTADHPNNPGSAINKVYRDASTAEAEAVKLAETMVAASRQTLSDMKFLPVTKDNIDDVLAPLQEYYGHARCYIDITQTKVIV